MEKRGATGSFGRFGERVVRRMSRKGGWVGLECPGGARWPAAAASTRALHEGFIATLLLSNSPRLKRSAELALQFSFYVRLALATLALRETSSAVTPAFRFSSLCRLISSPPQPFWEFLSSVLMRWGLMLSPSSPCPLIPFVTSQSCPVTLVLKRYLTIPIQL